jgi:flavin-dependent dehydrogenase
MASSYCAEAIVIGAGPAGLGVALGLARCGIEVVVLEQQSHIGSVRRGETIRYDKDMESLLGQGFFDRQVIKKIRKRTYYSHSGNRHVNRTILNPNNIINWQDFVRAMADVAESAGARIWTGSTVVNLMKENGNICGVRAMVQGLVEEDLRARVVFSCGGCDDPASRYLGIDRSQVDMPVFKQLAKDYTGPSDRLEYYFHMAEDGLTIGTIFPRGEKEAEIIILNTNNASDSLLSIGEFSEMHPLFKERLEGSNPFYTLKTKIPMGGMLSPSSQIPGLVMSGDALGHVQARGGSGIKTSFLIGYTAGVLGAEAIRSGEWSKEVCERFETELMKSPHMRSLKKHNYVYSKLRPMIFGRIKTPENMDRYWPLLKIALR